MITQLLNRSGLYLGPVNEMMPPHATDNPNGYWENLQFIRINDAILEKLGGSWDRPPVQHASWWKDPIFDALRNDATTLIGEFEQFEHWGWKDPRTSLTLPFWQDLVGDLKTVICVRHPLEVAFSLSRGGATRSIYSRDALQLWLTYYERIWTWLPLSKGVVTHLDSYFFDPTAELKRVLDHLDLEGHAETPESAVRGIQSSLRHTFLRDSDDFNWGVDTAVAGLYSTLCGHSGPVYQKMLLDAVFAKEKQDASKRNLYDRLFDESDRALQAEAEQEDSRQALNKIARKVQDIEQQNVRLSQSLEHVSTTLRQLESERAQLIQERAQLANENAHLTDLVRKVERKRVEALADSQNIQTRANLIIEERDSLRAQRDLLQHERELLYRSRFSRVLTNFAKGGASKEVWQTLSHLTQRRPIRYALDVPHSDMEIDRRGALLISGWAYSPSSSIQSITAFLDDTELGTVAMGVQRQDLASLFPGDAAALLSGFMESFDVGFISAGRHTLRLQIVDKAGHNDVIERSVHLIGQGSEEVEEQEAKDGPGDNESLVSESIPAETLNNIREWGAPVNSYTGTEGGENGYESKIVIRRAIWENGAMELEGWMLWPSSQPPYTLLLRQGTDVLASCPCNLSIPDILASLPEQKKAFCQGFSLHTQLPSSLAEGENVSLTVEIKDRTDASLVSDVEIPNRVQALDKVDKVTQDFVVFLKDYKSQTGQTPTILDWNSGLLRGYRDPNLVVFTPVEDGQNLPFIDKSVEVVLCPSSKPDIVLESNRVASQAVVYPINGENDGGLAIGVEWLHDSTTNHQWPSTSIVIPVYNQLEYTEKCLEQLKRTVPSSIEYEIIVVDDCSTDNSADYLRSHFSTWPELKVLQNEENVGFLTSCNKGAGVAQGEYLVFLNNDTLPQADWLPALLDTFRRFPDAGAVGGKLIYPDGTLQEAGGLIFSDGSGWNFGRNDAAVDHPLYTHVREVDYCSGALLATKRALFTKLGGFDTRYQPAYYEDVDYCFEVWKSGAKVYYQPDSVVIHFEGISSGTDTSSGVKKYQVVNKEKFVAKWHEKLLHQPASPSEVNYKHLHRLAVREN